MRRVLIVDDDDDIRVVCRFVLQQLGWEVSEAANGDQGLEVARTGRFEAFLLDQQMPGLTGLELASRLRTDGYDGPIILFSAYLDDDVVREAQTLGLRTLDKAQVNDLPEELDRSLS